MMVPHDGFTWFINIMGNQLYNYCKEIIRWHGDIASDDAAFESCKNVL
jgi:hypothetical protein